MTLEEYALCPRCGAGARLLGSERTPTGIRKKYRCNSCGWEFYGPPT
ncbi:MAG: hypothetical protein ACFFER_04795 [Candidatus Thorarchaeota archaeon]